MRGRYWWAVVAAFLVLLAAFGPELLRLGMLLAIPWNCDEGMAADWRAVNARGDIVAAYAKACTGVGTIVDYSVVLQLRGATLVEHSELYYGYPKFRRINDDMLSIDLGKVRAAWGEVDRVGSIRIAYSQAADLHRLRALLTGLCSSQIGASAIRNL